jgi:predicted lipoprotein
MRRALLIVLFGCSALSCRLPWTVRAIDAKPSEAQPGRPFDPAAYVASIWNSKVIPAASIASNFEQAKRDGRPTLVQGTGRVLRVDAERARLVLDILPFDGNPDAELDTGQIRGTALRDALPFIQFSQFVNQVDFAHAANALNDRASSAASAGASGITLGTVVSFEGALASSGGGTLPEIVPIVLAREPARP